MLSMVICRIRHWQTSGHLVKELNVCTVFVFKVAVGLLALVCDYSSAYLRWFSKGHIFYIYDIVNKYLLTYMSITRYMNLTFKALPFPNAMNKMDYS